MTLFINFCVMVNSFDDKGLIDSNYGSLAT